MKKLAWISANMLFLFILVGSVTISHASDQPKKQVLDLQGVKLWRTHKVTLSDDGSWYTVLYTLTEKPATKKSIKPGKKTAEKKGDKNKETALYGKGALTDVLYIRKKNSSREYQIAKGSNPVFSPTANWIAYSIKPESSQENKKNDKKSAKNIIELRNLKSGKVKQWKSNASYQFTKAGDHFVSSDKTSLLLCGLDDLKEHYVGNIGEFLLGEKSDVVAYTIASPDQRGNGIYLYNMKTCTTRALETGNYTYTNLSFNKDETAIASFKFKSDKKDKDPSQVSILTAELVNTTHPKITEYRSGDLTGVPDTFTLQVKKGKGVNGITWSNDNKRLFLSVRKKNPDPVKKDKGEDEKLLEKATLDVWHWKDKKLVSQQMMESTREQKKSFKAMFVRSAKRIYPLTGQTIQRIYIQLETDKWAIGTDNRGYISDWDVPKRDLYRMNLLTGEKKLIQKKYDGRIHISPDGEKAIFWRDGHYWYYDFNHHTQINITANVPVSFVKKDHDYYGSRPAYGFVGWVKNHDSVIVNHQLDLWQLPLDGKSQAVNLTAAGRGDQPIRFRLIHLNRDRKTSREERYINLSGVNLLSAFHIKTKYAGYFQLSDKGIKKLVYRPASYEHSRWRPGIVKAKDSNILVFKMGSYQDYPESFLSDTEFTTPKRITRTNPQQVRYKWGHRILIDYKNDDGVPLQGVLSIPDDYKKESRLPMIVYSYEKLSSRLFRYASPRISGIGFTEMMYVSDGYLVLQPDIHFNIGTPHSDMHECIDAAIRRVIELGYVDEKRIGYVGFSFGGHCGMFISTQKNKFAAIAAGAGVSNLVQGFNIDIVRDGSNEQDYYMTQQGRLGASPAAKPEMYLRESAVFNAKNMNTPLLLYHGTADSVVQWEHSFGLYSILRFLKKPVIFLSYRGEGHGLRKKANRIDMTIRLKEFFDHFLKGKDPPAWITEGIPFRIKAEKEKKKDKRTVPPWR